MVDLGSSVPITAVRIWVAVNAFSKNATEGQHNIANIWLTNQEAEDPGSFDDTSANINKCNTAGVSLFPASSPRVQCPRSSGRFVYVVTDGSQLGLCEVEIYSVSPACPESCATAIKRTRAIASVPQLAMASDGFQPNLDCASDVNVTQNNSNVSIPVCDGVPTLVAGELPSSSPVRLGGSFYHGFFVAPVSAHYTFRSRFNDVGQVWLSRDAKPENKELIIDGFPDSVPSGWFGIRWDPFQAHFSVAISSSGDGLPGALFASLLGSAAQSEEVMLVRGGLPSTVQIHIKSMEYWDKEGHLIPAGIIRALRLRSPEASACIDEVVVTVAGRGYSFQPPTCFGGDASIMHVDVQNSWPVQDLSATGALNASLTQDFGPVFMSGGEIRYFASMHSNAAGSDESLLTLEIDTGDGHFETSDVLGLSAEFFRVPASTPQLEVIVNNLVSACMIGGGNQCGFEYSEDRTPVMDSALLDTLTDVVEITGRNFGNISSVVTISVGAQGICHILNCSNTTVTCKIDAAVGAGRHTIRLYVHPWGYAEFNATEWAPKTCDAPASAENVVLDAVAVLLAPATCTAPACADNDCTAEETLVNQAVAMLHDPDETVLEVQWSLSNGGQPWETMFALVGDSITFTYSPVHDVYLHPTGDCSTLRSVRVGDKEDGTGIFTFDKEGNYTFACHTGTHCADGQILTIQVGLTDSICTAASGIFGAAPELSESTCSDSGGIYVPERAAVESAVVELPMSIDKITPDTGKYSCTIVYKMVNYTRKNN
jgi:hypothetical protein